MGSAGLTYDPAMRPVTPVALGPLMLVALHLIIAVLLLRPTQTSSKQPRPRPGTTLLISFSAVLATPKWSPVRCRLPAVDLPWGCLLPGKQIKTRICRLVDSPLSTRLWAASYRGNKKSLQICRLVDSPVGPVKSQPGMQVCSCRPASSRLGK